MLVNWRADGAKGLGGGDDVENVCDSADHESAWVEGSCISPAVIFRFLFGKAGHGVGGACSQVGTEVEGKVMVAWSHPLPGGVKRHSCFLAAPPPPPPNPVSFVKTKLVSDLKKKKKWKIKPKRLKKMVSR